MRRWGALRGRELLWRRWGAVGALRGVKTKVEKGRYGSEE